jgi:hypothetical protein
MRCKKVRILKSSISVGKSRKIVNYSLKYTQGEADNLTFLKELSTDYYDSSLPNLTNNSKKHSLFMLLSRFNSKPYLSKRVSKLNLKEKYSFFSHFFYRKNILRVLLKINVFSVKDGDNISEKNSNLDLINYYKYEHLFKNQEANHTNDNDFTIQRIRFKPGYQII